MKQRVLETEGTAWRGGRQGLRRGIYILPSTLTIGNIFCGFYALIHAIKGYHELAVPQVAEGFFNRAAIAIAIAWLLDNLDGRIARLTNTTSEFGVELDSIADFLSFGVAPAVLAYAWGYGSTPGLEKIGWAISFLFLICGALRLARFNVMARTSSDAFTGKTTKLDKRYFVGLPTPGAAGMVAGLIHFFPSPIASQLEPDRHWHSLLLLCVMGSLALLMVSTLRYSKFVDLGAKLRQPFVTLPLLSLLVIGIWFYSRWILLSVAGIYVLLGPLLKVGSLLHRVRRAATRPADRSGDLGR
jgi:CDP-diacylglycerol--serine O-phosphatidyltransferase